jgi:Ca2+-binding RTX toxin-like protein
VWRTPTAQIPSSAAFVLGDNIENLTLVEGSLAVNGNGGGASNIIIGNSADNELLGLAGKDQLIGNAGNDKLDGGDGDTMVGGLGDISPSTTSATKYRKRWRRSGSSKVTHPRRNLASAIARRRRSGTANGSNASAYHRRQ